MCVVLNHILFGTPEAIMDFLQWFLMLRLILPVTLTAGDLLSLVFSLPSTAPPSPATLIHSADPNLCQVTWKTLKGHFLPIATGFRIWISPVPGNYNNIHMRNRRWLCFTQISGRSCWGWHLQQPSCPAPILLPAQWGRWIQLVLGSVGWLHKASHPYCSFPSPWVSSNTIKQQSFSFSTVFLSPFLLFSPHPTTTRAMAQTTPSLLGVTVCSGVLMKSPGYLLAMSQNMLAFDACWNC